MVNHCLSEYGTTLKVEKVTYTKGDEGYDLEITIKTPQKLSIQARLELEEYISDSLEKYGGILIHKATVIALAW